MSRSIRFILVPLLLAGPAHAQDVRTLTGTVLVTEGVPFAGAEVRLLDTDVRVCADARGDFSIPVPAVGEARLRITPVGSEPKEVAVEPAENGVEVTLGDHVFVLDEVRVVGYSTSLGTARAAGNSIGRLEADDLDGMPMHSIEGAMQGKVAGAFIQANSGAPGSGYSIKLRGINTILGSSDPIIVVDGVVYSSGVPTTGSNVVVNAGRYGTESAVNRLSDINPADVERIEVLRGPSASAMYGSRASSGIVVITTKRGSVARNDGRSGEVLQCFIPGGGLMQIR